MLTPKLKQIIGRSTRPKAVQVDKSQVRRFAAAIGEDNPIHYDEDAAQAAGFPAIVGPPTFPAALTPADVFLDELDWDPQSVMHRAEEYEYYRPICAGDTITLTHRVTDIYEQPGGGGGSLLFAVVETRASDEKERPVFRGRRVLVKLKS